MKTMILFLMLLSAPQDSLHVMFWNVENFFDCEDTAASTSDTAFSPAGEKHWTSRRFYAKCSAVAKIILWAAQKQGALPDIVGFAEIENATVMRRLLYCTILRKTEYAYVHYDSPDPRGIDVALLYRRDRLKLKHSAALKISDFPTRDILETRFLTPEQDSIAVLVCHLPSKYSGASSADRRALVVSRLCAETDSLKGGGWKVVVMGDFNDVPTSDVFNPLEDRFTNLTGDLSGGTIKFAGNWEIIDQVLITPDLNGRAEICSPEFLLTKDKSYGGVKPLRTYTGPRYAGGISDHLPITAKIKKNTFWLFDSF